MSGQDNLVSFHINGKKYTVRAGDTINSHPKSLLIDYIRNEAGLTGTKYMCREGGCGACVVVAKSKDPVTGKKVTRAINSCLTPVYSCDGLDISTIERLGNRKEGYDVIQNRLVGFNGTQCGYCTPGFVMNMYGLMKNNQKLTAKEIEDSVDGNVCRCTGFRPILDAFKSLAVDSPEAIKQRCAEFEEATGKICPLKESCCKAGKCLKSGGHTDIEDCCRNSTVTVRSAEGQLWNKPVNLGDALELSRQYVSKNVAYRIVAGNTSTGIFKDEGPYTAYIDISGIGELKQVTLSTSSLVLGGGVTLSHAIEQLNAASGQNGFEYTAAMAKHWFRVANVPVRNSATIAGNLMIKHNHREFPSDIFLTLEAVSAQLSIVSVKGVKKSVTVEEFLNLDMKGNIIEAVHFPSLSKSEGYTFRSYKITKRYQNAHAYVNGAMLIKVDSKFNVAEKPRICFGGITPSFVHATATESFLVGKNLRDKKTLDGVLDSLEKELSPDFRAPDASPEYRKALARNLLYKTVLGIIGVSNSVKHGSGALDLERKLTSAKQVYDYKENEFPLTQPISKIEAVTQCSGEAEYINDIHPLHGELLGAFVLSTVANADLQELDASEALKVPGVVAFISPKDIPGENNYMGLWGGNEPIFSQGRIKAAGEALGLVVAENRDAAYEGVKRVKVSYANFEKPILTIKDGLAAAEKNGVLDKVFVPPAKGDEAKVSSTKYTASGEFELGGQYHFQMETHVTIAVPKEGSYDIYAATQFMDHLQFAVSKMLKIPHSNINVQVRRLGGGYGSKITRSSQVACAATLAAHVTNKPVRVVLDLETNMHMIGKRPPYLCKYEIGFDENGKIHNLKAQIVVDPGANPTDYEIMNTVPYFQNAYDSTGWEVTGGIITTNTVSNTYVRAPGTTQGIAMIEFIMEHVAHALKKDPLEVRLANLIQDGGTTLGFPAFQKPNGVFKGQNLIPKLVEEMKRNANYEERKKSVEAFNKANRWMKRGLSIVPMKYHQDYFSVKYPCLISIYANDGSVGVSHGGVEMGQGLNTKVVQVIAHSLNVPLDRIKVKPTNNLVAANGMCTGGAVGSELVSFAALQCCNILKERMAPVKAKVGEDVSWEKLVAACNAEGIDLRATYTPKSSEHDNLKEYTIWGLTLTEVEVDVLTGEFKVLRVDLIEDAGKSMSPEIDIGQVEGAFVMGLGLWALEKLHYDQETGRLLTNNTWEYKAPFAKDIPEDFRVSFLFNAPNPGGVLGSKATGEPPICMSISVVFALKHAIDSARQDAGNFDHYQINTPLTPEQILRLALTSKEQFDL